MPAADAQAGADYPAAAGVAAKTPDPAAEQGLATALSSLLSQLHNGTGKGGAPELWDRLAAPPAADPAAGRHGVETVPRSPTGPARVTGAPLPRRLGAPTGPTGPSATRVLEAEQPQAAAVAPKAADPPMAGAARSISGNADAFTHGGRVTPRPVLGPATAVGPTGTVGPPPANAGSVSTLPSDARPPATTTPASPAPAPNRSTEFRFSPRLAAAALVGLALVAGFGVSVAWWAHPTAAQAHATSCQQGASLGQQMSLLQGSFIVLEGRYLTALQSHDATLMQKDSSQMEALDEQAQTLSPEFIAAVSNCTHS